MNKYKKAKTIIQLIILMLITLDLFSQNIDSIERLIKNTSDKSDLLKLYKELSKAYTNVNGSKAITAATTQLKIAENLRSDIEIANAYKSLALACKVHGDDYKALKYYFREKTIRDKIDDKYGTAIVLANLGETYRAVFEHNKGIEYLTNALDLSKSLNYTYGTAYSLNRLASIYFELDDSTNYYKTIAIANESNNLAFKINDYALISNNYLLIGGSYSFFHKYDESIKYLFKSLENNAKSQELIHKSLILKSIAVVYYYKNEFNKTLEYSRIAMDEANRYNMLVYQWLAADVNFRTYKRVKQWDSAYKYLELYLDIKNKMYDHQKEYDLYRTELKYQKMDFERIEKANKEKQMMMLIIFVISIISILSILTLIIFRNKKLKKINKQLSEKNSIIENQKEELSILNSTKDKFFSIIAHDLKNPLGSFKFTTATLRNSFYEFTEEERIEFLDLMKDSAENVYSLLENLLEWSRTQKGTVSYNPILFDIYTLVTNNMSSVKLMSDHKNINIENKIQPNTMLKADINMINTIIRNLLTNAIKFTNDNGSIVIYDSFVEDKYQLSIKDSGIGMNNAKIEKLFRIDTQVSTLGTHNERGTGLGLILCKEFIEKHSGEIRVDSIPEKGSIFSIVLPINNRTNKN